MRVPAVDDRPDLTKKELAEFLGKPTSHVEYLVTAKKLPFYWGGNGRDPRFVWSDVLAYREKLRRENRVEPDEPQPRRRQASTTAYDKAVQREATRRKTKAAVP